MKEDSEGPGSAHWYSAVEAPERIDDASSVNWDAETDFVVVGKEPGSKATKAQKLGVKILDEAEFLRMCGG